ncbi:MAG: hypothetical protein J5916_06105 [Oscillospiraceae bacterium]|nr:hypothetical protein [Oscillospiraceae bacterium]
MSWHTVRMLAYGFLAGTAGVKLLSSQDAKKLYTQVTAATLRCVDDVVKTATCIKENCDDIAADAKAINEKRAEEDRAREIADAKALLAEAEGV